MATNVVNIVDAAALPSVLNGQPPEQVHGGQIAYEAYGNNAALKRASDTLQYAWDGLARIDSLRAAPHPEDRPATHAGKVARSVNEFSSSWATRMDSARANVKSELSTVEANLIKAANLKPVDRHFDSITSTFFNLRASEKAAAIEQLIEQNDGPTLATLLEAPNFVTGLSREQKDSARNRLIAKVDPNGLAIRDQLKVALVKLDDASIHGIAAQIKLLEGTDRFSGKVKAAEEVAVNARFGFTA